MTFLRNLFAHQPNISGKETIQDLQVYHNAKDAVARIRDIYETNTTKIRQRFADYCTKTKSFEDSSNPLEAVSVDSATYPYLLVDIPANNLNIDAKIAFGIASEPGEYGATLTRPDIFAAYYYDQITQLMNHHQVPVYVGSSTSKIPLPFVVDYVQPQLSEKKLLDMHIEFASPDLSLIDDSIANGTHHIADGSPMPLALFTAERVDFSLLRLHHYTGTGAQHFQGYILLTNYQRYIDEFIQLSHQLLQNDPQYTAFVEPNDFVTHSAHASPDLANTSSGVKANHLPQMPAYHLKRADGDGITFINIGVGPSNAKTITDHLAVLRPHCWIMLGHCGGLRRSQVLGDYVLAHGYVREDHVLDDDLPAWVPIPPIAEVQLALQEAVERITDHHGQGLKARMRTGTVVTTANRNWELRTDEVNRRYKQSRAIAVDMESATVAANGFRFRIPYGTLLCVSDKPIHGELKLRGMANTFYHQSVAQHLAVGLETMRLLREQGMQQLHSRKLRGFSEPPFR